MSVRLVIAAAAVVVGVGQAAEAATASFETETYFYLRLASAKIVGTGEDVTDEVDVGWVNGDYWYDIPRTGQIKELGCAKCVAQPGTNRVFEESGYGYSGTANGSGEAKVKMWEYWDYILRIAWNSDLAYPPEGAPETLIDVTIDYFIGSIASVTQTGKNKSSSAFSASSLTLIGADGIVAEVKASAASNGQTSQRNEIFGSFRATINHDDAYYFHTFDKKEGAANIAPVPLPASMAFIGTGAALLLGVGRRPRQAGANAPSAGCGLHKLSSM